MSEETKTKTYQKHPDRVTLGEGALARVNGWLDQVRSELRGIRLSRNDLVEYAILSQPEELPASSVAELKASRFDEVAFAAWALRELKAARAKGEKLTLAGIVSGAHAPRARRVKRSREKAQAESQAKAFVDHSSRASDDRNDPNDLSG
jgi:hypothetical protein